MEARRLAPAAEHLDVVPAQALAPARAEPLERGLLGREASADARDLSRVTREQRALALREQAREQSLAVVRERRLDAAQLHEIGAHAHDHVGSWLPLGGSL